MDVAPGTFYLGGEIDPKTGERTEQVLLYDAPDLTTHGVIVGMTGSGKTGLGLGMMEEALLNGVATLMIDPKGDMGNLLLLFPELRPEDFRPWIDEAAARREGHHPRRPCRQDRRELEGGTGRLGYHPGPHRQAARRRPDDHLHARLDGRCRRQRARLARPTRPELGHRGRGAARRDRGIRFLAAHPGRGRVRPGVGPGACPAGQHHRGVVAGGTRHRPGGSARSDRPAAVPQAGGIRGRCVLPGEGPDSPRHEAQRAGRLAFLRRLARGDAARHRRHALSRGKAGSRHPLSRPPLRQRASVRRDSLSLQAGHLDAAPVGDYSNLRALVYMDEMFGFCPADGRTPIEEADPHPAQAGAGLSASDSSPRPRTRSTSTTRRCPTPEPG